MTSVLDQTVLALRPLVYWKGARAEDASSIDIRDLSGNGIDANSWTSGGHADLIPLSLPGDDSCRRGWRGSGTGWFRYGSAVPGFSSTVGTILTICKLSPTALENNQALFDTAPAAVGAMRIYTGNNWTNTNFEIGGESAVSIGDSGFIRKGHFQTFAVGWRPQTGSDPSMVLWVDGAAIWTYNKTVTPVCNSLEWGSVNGSSFRAHADFHSLMMFDRFLNLGDQAAIYRAALMESNPTHSPHRLGRR